MSEPATGRRMSIRNGLEELGLPPTDLHELPTSEKRFPDGAQYRVEIPSTEGPRCLEALLAEAGKLDVPVHRVSQGSGVFMLTDAELDEFVAQAAAANVEISLFARPNAGWDTSATSRALAGGVLAASARGQGQLVAVLEDAVRAADHGVRSVLLADIGALYAFSRLRAAGVVPSDMQAKVSVMLPVATETRLDFRGVWELEQFESGKTAVTIVALKAREPFPGNFQIADGWLLIVTMRLSRARVWDAAGRAPRDGRSRLARA
jgi:hypothetical protein